MRIETDFYGVGKSRVYYATQVTPGRPRKGPQIKKSRKAFGTGTTRQAAINDLLNKIGFVAWDAKNAD